MTCPVSEQIAMHADEPEQIPVCEILSAMFCAKGDGRAYINGEWVEDFRIADSIDSEELLSASLELMRGNGLAVYELYIKALEELIND